MTKILKKTIIILNIVLLISTLTSCKGSRELDEIGIVVATGIDKEDGKVILTNEVINPALDGDTKHGAGGDPTLFVQGVGDTIEEAITDIRSTFDRELYHAHNYIIIIGESIAKEGFGTYIDILSRSNEQREQAYMLIAEGDKAYNLMGGRRGIGTSSGKNIYNVIKKDLNSGKGAFLTLHEFFKLYYKENEGLIIAVAKNDKKPEIDKSKSGSNFEVVRVSGGAVVKHDKLQGYLTGDEMLGFNFIQGDIKSAIVTFKAPKELNREFKYVTKDGEESSFQSLKTKTKREVKIIDGKLHLYIDVVTRGKLTEVTQGVDINQPKIFNKMEKACAKEIESRIYKTMGKAQGEYNIDIFGISSLVHREHPKLWNEIKNDWNNIFTNLDYTVNVKVNFTDTGFTNAPPNIRKDM